MSSRRRTYGGATIYDDNSLYSVGTSGSRIYIYASIDGIKFDVIRTIDTYNESYSSFLNRVSHPNVWIMDYPMTITPGILSEKLNVEKKGDQISDDSFLVIGLQYEDRATEKGNGLTIIVPISSISNESGPYIIIRGFQCSGVNDVGRFYGQLTRYGKDSTSSVSSENVLSDDFLNTVSIFDNGLYVRNNYVFNLVYTLSNEYDFYVENGISNAGRIWFNKLNGKNDLWTSNSSDYYFSKVTPWGDRGVFYEDNESAVISKGGGYDNSYTSYSVVMNLFSLQYVSGTMYGYRVDENSGSTIYRREFIDSYSSLNLVNESVCTLDGSIFSGSNVTRMNNITHNSNITYLLDEGTYGKAYTVSFDKGKTFYSTNLINNYNQSWVEFKPSLIL